MRKGTLLRAHGKYQRSWSLKMGKLRLWTLKHKVMKLLGLDWVEFPNISIYRSSYQICRSIDVRTAATLSSNHLQGSTNPLWIERAGDKHVDGQLTKAKTECDWVWGRAWLGVIVRDHAWFANDLK